MKYQNVIYAVSSTVCIIVLTIFQCRTVTRTSPHVSEINQTPTKMCGAPEPRRSLLWQLRGDGFVRKCPDQSALHSVHPYALHASPPSSRCIAVHSQTSTWIVECLCFEAGLTFSTQDGQISGSQRMRPKWRVELFSLQQSVWKVLAKLWGNFVLNRPTHRSVLKL